MPDQRTSFDGDGGGLLRGFGVVLLGVENVDGVTVRRDISAARTTKGYHTIRNSECTAFSETA
jgi:hypothetical protein